MAPDRPTLGPRTLVAWIGAIALFVCAPAAVTLAGEPAARAGEPWIRLVEDDRGMLRLQMAQRTYRSVAEGAPDVTLYSAVHVGARPYYRSMQRSLEGYDLVLYEGVNPSGAGEEDAFTTDPEREGATERRLRLLAILLERHHADAGAYPESLDALGAWLEGEPRRSAWLAIAREDAWGVAVDYAPPAGGAARFTLTSRGADGRPGTDDDLDVHEQPPLSASEIGATRGLQSRLASAFGLTFQLEEMDESRPHWRNSDLSMDEVSRRLEAAGGGDSFLFGMLDGSSFMGSLAAGALAIVERLPGASSRGRLMIMEMLAIADETFMAASMPGGEALLKVIIDDRNQKVIDDLTEVIAREPDVRTLAVIYGAGHMPDLERRLEAQLGYAPVGETTWVDSMRLNLRRAGIAPSERAMIRASIARQLEAARRSAAEGD